MSLRKDKERLFFELYLNRKERLLLLKSLYTLFHGISRYNIDDDSMFRVGLNFDSRYELYDR